jgi:hypothetical protein
MSFRLDTNVGEADDRLARSCQMDKEKKARLEAQGWKVGSTEEFLGLTPDEAAYVDLRLKLSDACFPGEGLAPEIQQGHTKHLVGPHGVRQDFGDAYREMAGDEHREAEAHEWVEATVREVG